MFVKNSEIAERLSVAREIAGLTPEQVSEKLNINVDTYLKYENSSEQIPISVINDACRIFGVSVTELLTGNRPKLNIFSVCRKDHYVDTDRVVGYKYKDIAPGFANRKVLPLLVTVEPETAQSEGHSLNVHQGQEFHYCIEGSYKVYIDKHEVVVNEGDTLMFDSSHPHAMEAVSEKAAKIIVIVI